MTLRSLSPILLYIWDNRETLVFTNSLSNFPFILRETLHFPMCRIRVDDGFDTRHFYLEAKHRWLEPSEVCEILQNHGKFRICARPESMPSDGKIILFDRKELRCYRNDGYNWKKRKNGKAVAEGNEKLKAGKGRVLHCYYAHGEENKNFKRRIYSMHEEDLSHIVLVHYREVKRKKEYRSTVKIEDKVDNSSFPLPGCLDSYTPRPSPSHDLLFSIDHIVPDSAYENSKTQVLIVGRFLKDQHAESCEWSCMFGEVEVRADVIKKDVLCCYTPLLKAGTLSFYVKCSNRPGLACSEEKKFEYHSRDYYSKYSAEALHKRFDKLLSSSSTSPNCDPTCMAENSELSCKISSLLKNDNDQGDNMLQCWLDKDFSWQRLNEQSLQPLKKKLHAWLLQKVAAGGKGLSVLDEGGQGVLHFGAALGYDWVLLPTITAGVTVDFHDNSGWTALHWAAFSGRKGTVALLISLGAAPGALTSPTECHTRETPAQLAWENGHLEIAHDLAKMGNGVPESMLDEVNFVT